MVASASSLVGTTWESKDGKHAVRVESEHISFGIRDLRIINLETRRVSRITATGLFRKFTRATPFT
jgi:hypothetical protein